jgi:ankyrin repeat protein
LVAAFKGYLKLVRLFLDQGAAINHVSGDREHAHWERPYLLPHLAAHPGTALWAACLNGHLDIVQLLVDRGALDLDFALMAASRGGHLEIIQYLIAKGADINAREKEGFYGTTLQAASLGGHSKVVRFLCEQGAEDHRYYGHYETALESASRRGYGEVVRILLERRDKTTYKEEDFVEAFQYASNFDDSQAVNFIADYVSNVSLSTPMSTKALQIAVTEGHSSVVQSLFQKGADVKTHAQDRASNLLVSAARRGHAEVIEVLLGAGAEINAIDDDGNLAIHVAAKGGHIEVVDVLLDAGADVNALDGYQSYALHAAARGGHSEVVETLLDAEADVNALDKYQMSALHVAAGGGHSEIVEVLLEAEADLNAQDLYQRSPLHFAARGNHLKVANVLLDNEADVNLRFDGHRLSGYRHCPGPDHCSGTATASETARHYKHLPIITAIGNTKRYVPRKPSAVDPHLFNGW